MNENNTQPLNTPNTPEFKPVPAGKSLPKAWIAGAVLAGLLLLWFAPPLAAELYLANNIDKFINTDITDDVSLKTNTFQLLAGKFSSFHISGNNLLIGNLRISQYMLEATEGRIDIIQTLKKKDIILENSPIITLTLDVSINDMAYLLQEFYPSLSDMQVVAAEGYMIVSGTAATPAGKDLPVSFKVALTTDDWASLRVDAYELTATPVENVTDEEIAELTEIYSVSIPFDGTTPPIYINKVVVSASKIIITANSSLN